MANWLNDAGNAISDFTVGNSTDPGFLGLGQYGVDPRAGEIQGIDGFQQRLAQGPTFDPSRPDQFRNQQLALAGNLMGVINGTAPSVANLQLQQGLQGNLAATVAAGNSLRGPGGAANAGQLLAQQAAARQEAAGQAALLRAQESAQARGQLGQVLDSGRGQDQQQQQAEQQLVLQYIQAGLSAAEAQQRARLEMEQLKSQAYYQTAQNRYGTVKDIAKGIGSVAGLGATGPGGAAPAAPIAV